MQHALIIADDLRLVGMLEGSLARLGFGSFDTAGNEEEAVAAAQRHPPDLVVVGGTACGAPILAARRIAKESRAAILLAMDSRRDSTPRLPLGATLDGPFPLGRLAEAIGQAKRPATVPVAA